MSEKEKILVLNKEHVDPLLENLSSDIEKSKALLKNHFNDVCPLSEEAMYMLCEIMTSTATLERQTETLFRESNRIEKELYRVDPDALLLLTSLVKLIEAMKETLQEENVFFQEN